MFHVSEKQKNIVRYTGMLNIGIAIILTILYQSGSTNMAMTWEQPGQFRHVVIVMMTCWSPKQAPEKNDDLRDLESGMLAGLRQSGLSILDAVDLLFLAHFWPLNSNWAPFKYHGLAEYCCWPCPSLYDLYYDDQRDNAPSHKAQIITS